MPDKEIVSPQTTGDLIGRAIRVYRANIRQWAPILIWPTVMVLSGRVIYQASLGSIQKDTSGSFTFVGGFGLIVGFIVVIFGKWILVQKQLAFVRLANGFSKTLADAQSYLKTRKWSIAGLAALCLIMLMAVAILWMLEIVAAGVLLKVLPIPAALAIFFGFLGLFVSTLFIMFALFLSLAALACETGGATSLLSRGFTMASKCFFRTMFCGFVVIFTVNLLATPMWLPISVAGALDSRMGSAWAGTQGVPIHWQVIVSAWETLIEMVTQPILYLAYGFYYYDLRLRYEGVDVIEELETLKLKRHALLDAQ